MLAVSLLHLSESSRIFEDFFLRRFRGDERGGEFSLVKHQNAIG
jgi:hypothetical protein